MTYSLVAIGELLWDIFVTGKELGGAPANFAGHVAALGGEGLLVSCVGADRLGKEMRQRLEDLSLHCDYVAVDGQHPTGMVSVHIDAEGRPSYTIAEDVAWDFIPQTEPLLALAKNAHAITFGTLAQRSAVSRATIREFVRQVPADALSIFDLNLRQEFYSREIIEWSLGACNVLKLSDEELPVLARLFSLAGDQCRLLDELSRRFNIKLTALTRGARGSLLYSPGQKSVHRGYPVKVVDTVGSGDAFTAALALGMLAGSDIETINDYANRVASFVCSRRGAVPRLPEDFQITRWLSRR